MKEILVLIIVIIGFASCKTPKSNLKSLEGTATNDTIVIKNDSLEYEIVIIEPGFFGWLATQRPRGYYSQGFLETRNLIYVNEYNQRVHFPQQFDPLLYQLEINYTMGINYGYEVNYLLYHYFLYFQERYNQRFTISRGGNF